MRAPDILDFIWPWARLGALYREIQRLQTELRTERVKVRQLESTRDYAKRVLGADENAQARPLLPKVSDGV